MRHDELDAGERRLLDARAAARAPRRTGRLGPPARRAGRPRGRGRGHARRPALAAARGGRPWLTGRATTIPIAARDRAAGARATAARRGPPAGSAARPARGRPSGSATIRSPGRPPGPYRSDRRPPPMAALSAPSATARPGTRRATARHDGPPRHDGRPRRRPAGRARPPGYSPRRRPARHRTASRPSHRPSAAGGAAGPEHRTIAAIRPPGSTAATGPTYDRRGSAPTTGRGRPTATAPYDRGRVAPPARSLARPATTGPVDPADPRRGTRRPPALSGSRPAPCPTGRTSAVPGAAAARPHRRRRGADRRSATGRGGVRGRREARRLLVVPAATPGARAPGPPRHARCGSRCVELEGGSLTALAGVRRPPGHRALVVAPRRWATIEDIPRPAPSSAVSRRSCWSWISLEDPQNVGTLLRSAEAARRSTACSSRPTARRPLTPVRRSGASGGATEHLLAVPGRRPPGRARGTSTSAARAWPAPRPTRRSPSARPTCA